MKQAKDNFSVQATQYARFRPHYPDALYEYLFSLPLQFNTAWDCGTGNGQVAVKLAEKYKQVYATDISEAQLQQASKKDNITYLLSRAENTPLPDTSIDLITVATALHWFDIDAFFEEVKRVARPGAYIAAWSYSLVRISPEIDPVILNFYSNTLGPYWDPERRLMDEEYKSISFPFEEIQAPPFRITVNWSLSDFLGYLSSWSSMQHYIRKEHTTPLDPLKQELLQYWQDDEVKELTFPLFMRLGKV
ncbi:class I SAM-dependent methyltransferase [Pontibacter vulgaris]|uniref:class I SAM-dependent methyltransferase n=1 Tax=Pontibacter vulgaris TaxID=2905679 RepID=UPI001FA7B056|nr:class I SAM-dependent methyltransferase [Pontibacter vulgaris]